MKSTGLHIPHPGNVIIKTAEGGGVGLGAILGALFGGVGQSIPALESLRQVSPIIYNAILGAAILTAARTLEGEEQQSVRQGPLVNPPPWTV